jgi:hypothetical protein
MWCVLQVQQQIAQEYEQVKATTNTIQLFKVDTHVDRPIGEQFECCDKRDWTRKGCTPGLNNLSPVVTELFWPEINLSLGIWELL